MSTPNDDEKFNVAKNRLKAIRSTIKRITVQKERESAVSHAHESYQGEKERGTMLKKMSSAIKIESSGSERLVIKGLFSERDVNDERELIGEYNLSEDSLEK